MKTRNRMTYDMKTTSHAILGIIALGLVSALGQQPAPPPPKSPPPIGGITAPPPEASFSERLQKLIQKASEPPAADPNLTKFNLDFPGGTPNELVAAIEKATGRPLNAFVKDEFSNTRLPALKMTNVTVPQLFQALVEGSKGAVAVGSNMYSTQYGFTTQGSPSDDSIWYFFAYKGIPPAKVCRFYSLAPYVDSGLSVDDITTAIETGWKMLWEEGTSMPTMKYHKDTKLLIAVGEPSKLETIDAVLKALQPTAGGGMGGGFPSPGRRPAIRPSSSEAK